MEIPLVQILLDHIKIKYRFVTSKSFFIQKCKDGTMCNDMCQYDNNNRFIHMCYNYYITFTVKRKIPA